MVTPTLLVLPTPYVAASGCQAGGAAPAAADAAPGREAPATTAMAATVPTTSARHRRTSVPTTTGFDQRGRYPVFREVPDRIVQHSNRCRRPFVPDPPRSLTM